MLTNTGLTMNDWNDFEDVMLNGTQAEQDNWDCWMKRYLTEHVSCGECECPDDDPFE